MQWVNLALRVTRFSPYIQGTFCVLPKEGWKEKKTTKRDRGKQGRKREEGIARHGPKGSLGSR